MSGFSAAAVHGATELIMSSSRPSVSRLDSLMEELVNPTLSAGATASATGSSGGLDETAFKAAIDANLDPLDLKMAFGMWEATFDSNVKA